MDDLIDQATRLINIIIPFSYIMLATVGNILSFKVMSMTKNISSSTVYLKFLAVADMLSVDIPYSLVFVGTLVQQLFWRNTDAACKLFYFVTITTSDIAIWIVPLLSLDRVLALFLPTRSRQYSNPRTARIALISLLIIAMLKNLTYLIFDATRSVASENNTGSVYCGVYPGLEQFAYIRFLVETTLVAFLPVTAVIVMNTMIVVGIRGRLAHMSASGDPETIKALKNSITLTLTVSVAYVIFLVPSFTYSIIPAEQLNQLLGPTMNYFIWLVLVNILYLNHVCNFILYVIVSPTFRKDLRSMICRPRNRVAQGSIIVDTSVSTVA